jgi:hypothetical protein
VRAKSARLGVHSSTGAQADVFRSRGQELSSLERAFPLHAGQSGAVLALGEDLCLDYVSRPDAFARLYPKLLTGYLLDAIERLDRKPATTERVRAFVEATEAAATARHRSPGLGEDVRLSGDRVLGSGLELDGELVQLCAFTSAGRDGRIARPSRRG